MMVAAPALMRQVREAFPPFSKFRKPCHDNFAPGFSDGLGGFDNGPGVRWADAGGADASRGRADVSCASALPKDLNDWAATIEFLLGANATGKDLKELSVFDKSRAQDRSAALACRQGLGTLIAKLGESLPVSLGTAATR